MSSTFNNPAEFPEGSEGGTGPIRRRPVGGGPGEFPVFRSAVSYQALINEIVSLTTRVQGLETQLQMLRLGGHFPRPGGGPHELPQISTFERAGGPQELEMEGGEGGGTGVFRPVRHEIQEFPGSEINRILQVVSLVNERISGLEAKVLGAIEKISR